MTCWQLDLGIKWIDYEHENEHEHEHEHEKINSRIMTRAR